MFKFKRKQGVISYTWSAALYEFPIKFPGAMLCWLHCFMKPNNPPHMHCRNSPNEGGERSSPILYAQTSLKKFIGFNFLGAFEVDLKSKGLLIECFLCSCHAIVLVISLSWMPLFWAHGYESGVYGPEKWLLLFLDTNTIRTNHITFGGCEECKMLQRSIRPIMEEVPLIAVSKWCLFLVSLCLPKYNCAEEQQLLLKCTYFATNPVTFGHIKQPTCMQNFTKLTCF